MIRDYRWNHDGIMPDPYSTGDGRMCKTELMKHTK